MKHTEKDDGYGYQDHENVVVADERYQALDTDGEPNVGHDDGVVWNEERWFLQPAGDRLGG
jgi:hypothetical protein